MLPGIVYEESIRSFAFVQSEQVLQGMIFEKKFYRLAESFHPQQRVHAYKLSFALSAQGHHTVISLSPEACKVWVDLVT